MAPDGRRSTCHGEEFNDIHLKQRECTRPDLLLDVPIDHIAAIDWTKESEALRENTFNDMTSLMRSHHCGVYAVNLQYMYPLHVLS